jgi:hypothetical protein
MAMFGVLMSTAGGLAQELPIETSPERREPDSRSEPRRLPDTPTSPSRESAYPRDVGVRHEPVFIAPLAGRYDTPEGGGRFGLSGWTSPNPPIGPVQSGANEINGWFSFGFSFTWGDPH